jgi:hypothetical protein
VAEGAKKDALAAQNASGQADQVAQKISYRYEQIISK